MVVGNGLIASVFKQYRNREDIVIMASGVSNSKSSVEADYTREKELLSSVIHSELVVYFSTCSVFDKAVAKTAYVQHKFAMEAYIQENAEQYLIVRLPIVVGPSKNPHTLTNFIFQSIINNKHFNLYRNAYRYLIDIDDVGTIVPLFIEDSKMHNRVINICFDNQISVKQIVLYMEEVLQKKGNYALIEDGSSYIIDNSIFISKKEQFKGIKLKDYSLKLLKKYYGKS